MLELRELISLVSRHKIKQIDVIGNDTLSPTKDTLYTQLYDAVRDNKVTTDDDAVSLLYNDHPHASQAYNRLKNRLKDRLLNTLFFIDINQPKFSDIEKALISCNRNWMAVRIMLLRDARTPAIKLAERTLRVAVKYEFTELVLYLAKELRFHYSLVHSKAKKYKSLNKIIDEHSEIFFAELTADKLYSEIMIEFGGSQYAAQKGFKQRVSAYSDKLLSEFSHINSYRFIRISHLLHVVRFQVHHQYAKAIDACKKAITIIQNKPYTSGGAIFSFNLRLLSCYVQLRQFESGEEVAVKYTKRLPSGSHQWFVAMFYYFLLCTHSKQYDKSLKIIQAVFDEDKFNTLYDNIKQLWLVNEAFVHFLISVNIISNDYVITNYRKRFRLYRFLNDIPIYSKDKRGVNISILVIHVLFLLQQRKFSAIIDRVDALNQYCHRYLRRDDTFRANCFIKMLLQIPKAGFNRIRTERYAQKYVDRLEGMPLNMASQGVEIEVVPYEHLWKITLDLLDNKQ